MTPSSATSPSRAARLRAYGLTAALLVGAGIFLVTVNTHHPIREWLFWRYASYWLWCLLFVAACLGGGHLVLRRLGERQRLDQHLLFSFALGVLVFYLGMFLGGLLGLYGRIFAVAWPVLLVAAGGRGLVAHLRPRLGRLLRARPLTGRQWLALAPVAAFGMAGAGMLYFLILTPDNTAYDARWYHLGLAEQYAVHGGIRRFSEGWYQATFPHLASFVYTWAFQVPGTAGLFDRIELAAHLEFVLFLATLAGIPAAVRWVIPGMKARFAWAALFLFPGIFLYDSSLGGAADHVAAFWAIPLYLAFARAWPALSPRRCLLLAAMMAGAISTKYQSISILAFPVAAIGVRAVWLLWQQRRPAVLAGPGLAALGAVVLTAPHWLKNWVWHGDPFYPHLHKLLVGRPWTPDSGHLVEAVFKGMQMWQPTGSLGERLAETGKALFTFSFIPHDWPAFHGAVPVFGSLFTLSLLALPFLRPIRRLWPLVLATHLAVFVYYWSSHQDRYLQIILPWMAVAVAVVVGLAWRMGHAARAGLAVLLGVQIVWGGDVYFLPTHAMIGGSPVNTTVTLLSSGYRKDYRERFRRLGPTYEVGQRLPPGAKVLLHESHITLGLGAAAVSDWGGWQGGISYGRMGSPRGMYQQLRALGVTHLVWAPGASKEWDSLAGDLLFHDFVTRFAIGGQPVGGVTVAAMPERAPADAGWNDQVLYLGCPGRYAPGLYRLDQLTVPQNRPGQGALPRAPHATLPGAPGGTMGQGRLRGPGSKLPRDTSGGCRPMEAPGHPWKAPAAGDRCAPPLSARIG